MSDDLRFDHVSPQFRVHDVAESAAFYSAALHFEVMYFAGDPPTYAVVCRDEVYLHLCAGSGWAENLGAGAAFITVSDVDELWERVDGFADVEIVYPLEDRDYGDGVLFRDFALSDPDGNVLRIGQEIDSEG